MKRTVTAVFDGKALLPETQLDLKANSRYEITIDDAPAVGEGRDAWDELESLAGTVEAPEDWAKEHDHYLYGSPKHQR